MDKKSDPEPARITSVLGGGLSPQGRSLALRAGEPNSGSAHTDAAGDDRFPVIAPTFIVRGRGCHAKDDDGNESIKHNTGLHAVTLGHEAGNSSEVFRTLFLHETIRRGVIASASVVSPSLRMGILTAP